MAHLTTYQLEKKCTQISFEKYNELIETGNFTLIQNRPKNLLSTYSIIYDETLGGIFLWSGGMQRYFLIAKRKN